MPRLVRTLAGLVLAGCYAAIAMASGLDRISEVRPDVAALVPEPFRVNAARALAVDALKAQRYEPALAEARLALIRDPVDARSAGLFGSVLLAAGNAEGARSAFTLSAALGWRDAPTQLFWMAQALNSGDLKTASQRLDALLRQNPMFEQRQPLLALLEASPAGRDQLVARLADQPAWRTNYYMDTFMLTPLAVSHRADVAERLAQSAGVRDCQLVAPVTHGLVSQKDFAAARRVWDLHCRPEDDDDYLADGGFDRASPIKQVTAFDWSWFDDSMVGVSLQPAAGFAGPAVSVGTTAPALRRFAQQLVLLEPGSYRASWRAQSLTGEPAAGIGLSLACDKESLKPLGAAMDDARLGRFAADFSVPAGCPAQWLTFTIAPGTGDAELDDVAVTDR